MFVVLSGFFLIYSVLKTFVVFTIEGIYCCFFLSKQKNLYMIHHDSDLFYDIYYTINKFNQIQSHYLSYGLNYFDIYFK